MHDAGVRVHAAFGQARGAAGVGQYGQVLRRGRVRGKIVGTCVNTRKRIGPAHHFAAVNRRQRMRRTEPVTPGLRHRAGIDIERVAVVRDDQVRQAQRGLQLRIGFDQLAGQIGRRDGDFGIRVNDVVLQLFRPVHRVDRHHHRVGPQDSEVRDDPLRAVLHVQHHAVAAAHADAVQRGRQSLGLLHQLAIRQHPVKKYQRRFVGVTQCADGQVVPQRRGRRRDAARQALGPKGEMGCRGAAGGNRVMGQG